MNKSYLKRGVILDVLYNKIMKNISVRSALSGTSIFITLLHVRSQCTLTLRNRTFHTLPGDLLLLKKDIPYSSDSRSSLIAIDIESAFVDSLFDAQISDCRIIYELIHTPSSNDEYLYFSKITSDSAEFLNLLIEESSKEDSYHEKIMRLLLVGLFSTLDRSRNETLLISNSTMGSENRFGRIMKYISDNYRTVTLEETARKFGYNPDYLSARFKMITGMSFSKKLLSIRMEEAIHRLLTTDYTISEISTLVGYQDRSHFSRNFREYTGMTPKQYRKIHKAL